MLEFPEEYFEDEVREDFLVDATMKRFWAATIEVLREISEVCERHNIQWYAAYGTLLGAIRHEGFVPWDDDMDIWMKREDYDEFMRVAPQELPKGYRIRSCQVEGGHFQFHSFIVNSDKVSIEEEHLQKFHGNPYICGVDIFPLDILPDNESERETENIIFELITSATVLTEKEERSEEEEQSLQNALDVIEPFFKVNLEREKIHTDNYRDVTSMLFKLANKLCASYREEDGANWVYYMDYWNWPTKVYPKEWFADVQAQLFENVMIPVPVEYDEILKKIYGDYQKRIRNTACHDYPIYKSQLEKVIEMKDEIKTNVQKMEDLVERYCGTGEK